MPSASDELINMIKRYSSSEMTTIDTYNCYQTLENKSTR